MKQYLKSKTGKTLLSLITCICSSLLQAIAIQAFIEPSHLISGGITGLALLLNSVSKSIQLPITTSIWIILLNAPLAMICYKYVSKRFAFYSTLNFVLTSILLGIVRIQPLFDDIILNISFGGFISAMSVVIALKGHASTGGTDFIALYFSNKYNKAIWEYIFIGNVIMIIIFGFTTNWINAGYTILFQFIATRTVATFHTRYQRITLQITTTLPNEVITSYVSNFKHGITVLNGYGGYSKKPVSMLTTVVSSYEVSDVIDCIKIIDPNVIINVFTTKDFVGSFHHQPLD